MAGSKIALYIDPPSHHFKEDRLFNAQQVRYGGDHLMAPYTHLKQVLEDRNIAVHTADLLPAEAGETPIVYIAIGRNDHAARAAALPRSIFSAFFALECPIVEPALYRRLARVKGEFKRLFSWSDSESLQRFTGEPLRLEHFFWPQSFDTVHEDLWRNRDRKFLVMINSNKLPEIYWQELYTERLRAVTYFSQTGEIDLYGREWGQPSHKLGRTWLPYTVRRAERELRGWWQKFRPDPNLVAARRVYRGTTPSKSQTLSEYTFAICFENMIFKGWITEKIFDCFYTGTIPIYWGEPEIEQVIPPNCFVDMRRFSGYDELATYLRGLSSKEIEAYRENARSFLESSAFYPFSKEAFAEIFCRIIAEDTGLPVGRFA